MKGILTLTALLAVAATASAQGTVNFANNPATKVAINSLPGGPSTGFITGPVGSYYFALLVAPTTQTTVDFNFSGWAFTGNYATNTQSPGRFNGNPTTDGVTIVGYAPGSTANFVVVGWSSGIGHDWGTVAPALANGLWFTGYAGMSGIAQNIVLGGGFMYPPTPLSSGFTLSPGCLGPYFEYFTWQPTNQAVNLGATAIFNVAAAVCPAPASYQWFFNGRLISGAGQSVYQIPNVQWGDMGDYYAVLYNPAWAQCCGHNAYHTSAVATLTVLTQPIITSQPQSQTAYVGTAVDLRIVAVGSGPLSYQWCINGTPTPGATNADLLLTKLEISASGSYVAVVTNAIGAVTSPPAMLNVIAAVERRPVPAVRLTGETGNLLNVAYADSLSPAPIWTTLGSMILTNASQFCFDVSERLPAQRFYRTWQSGTPGVVPALSLPSMVPAITLRGNIGDTFRVDYITQFGPIDAWATLATVTLTNTSQLYFDTASIGQPPRLWRIVPGP